MKMWPIKSRNLNLTGIFLVLFAFSISSRAQNNTGISISGRVIDKDTRRPLSYATVFLSNTTFGAYTDKNGNFQLKDIPFGVYDIVFSFVGYEVETRNFYSYSPKFFNFNIEMKQKAINLKEVNIVAQSPDEWNKKIKVFTREFIGQTENAEQTKILNPEIIEFTGPSASNFQGYSDSVIKVENRHLGYMLYILLDKFIYNSQDAVYWIIYPRFEELSPASIEEKHKWEDNRRKCFLGSKKHFFLSLVNKRLSEESFKAYSPIFVDKQTKNTTAKDKTLLAVYPLPDSALIVNWDDESNNYSFKHETFLNNNWFEIRWKGNNSERTSSISFDNDYTLIDPYGNLMETRFSCRTFGYWATQRIADLLPATLVYKMKDESSN